MKTNKKLEGENFPKSKILKLVKTFGLCVDYDQWDEDGKNWIRVESSKYKEAGCVIIQKDDLEFNVHQEETYIEETFQNFLMRIGEIKFKKKLNNLLEI